MITSMDSCAADDTVSRPDTHSHIDDPHLEKLLNEIRQPDENEASQVPNFLSYNDEVKHHASFEYKVSDEKFAAEIPEYFNRAPEILQKWDGRVTSIDYDKNLFYTEMKDKSGKDQIGEFYIDEIEENERDFLFEGSLFVWTIAKVIENGSVRRKTEFYFRRLPEIDEEEKNTAIKRAAELFQSLKIDV